MEKLEYTKVISIKIMLDRNKGVPIIMYSNKAGKSFANMEEHQYFVLDIDFMKGLSMV